MQLQARLIDDLLDLTRIARGMLHLEMEDCDAHKIIENALEMAKSAIAAKQFNLSTGLKAKRYHILADCIRLQQVFWNLINNAVKFTSQGGQITLRTFNDKDGRFHFEIEDTGIGIEPQRLASLFQPFEQADPSVGRQFGGLGLDSRFPNVSSISITAELKRIAVDEVSVRRSRLRWTLSQRELQRPG